MANVQITQLPAAQPLTGTELVPIVQNGVTVRTTVTDIAVVPAFNESFLTVNQESSLANSRYFSTDANMSITDNGAQSYYRIGLVGPIGDLNTLGDGFVVKSDVNTLVNRSFTTSTIGLTVANGDGVSGNPSIKDS